MGSSSSWDPLSNAKRPIRSETQGDGVLESTLSWGMIMMPLQISGPLDPRFSMAAS